MIRSATLVILLFAAVGRCATAPQPGKASVPAWGEMIWESNPSKQLGERIEFTQNRGQWNARVKFRCSTPGGTMWLTNSGTIHQFSRAAGAQTGFVEPAEERERFEWIAVGASLVDANEWVDVEGLDPLEHRHNYFLGDDSGKWFTDVPNFGSVFYRDVYDRIDLKYHSNHGHLEYDFIVYPGGDYTQIRMKYAGHDSLSVDEVGNLVIATPWGAVIERKPRVYSQIGPDRVSVAARFKLLADGTFGFELAQPHDVRFALVIDPVLLFSTHLGGSDRDFGFDIAVDESAGVYVAGACLSSDFPLEGEFQGEQSDYDGFVTKLGGTDLAPIYSSYIGGGAVDEIKGICVDGSGCAYFTGKTESTDFPTVGEIQADQGGIDAFVTKLAADGSSLIYSTYLGGSAGWDRGSEIAVDDVGCAYVVGPTSSTDFPTQNALQDTYMGDLRDCFVTKLNAAGNAPVFSTYLGGSDIDDPGDIVVDASGYVYITGNTGSTDFPTLGAGKPTETGQDVFVTKLDQSGSNLVYSAFIGGTNSEAGHAIWVDASGTVYVAGATVSTDYPVVNEYQNYMGEDDAFVFKLSSTGDALIYSTYLGGALRDVASDMVVDADGCAIVVGRTSSSDFPIMRAYQSDQGGFDAFVTKLGSAGNTLLYSTYFGGSGTEHGNGIAIDPSGDTYIVGATASSDYPTNNEFQSSQGEFDAFVIGMTAASTCCWWRVGDANGPGNDEPTIGDISILIEAKFISGDCEGMLDCLTESDVNQSGGLDPSCDDITIGDISTLIDYLFITGPNIATLPTCL